MELKFVNISYFKQLFQNIRPKLQYSKNIIFVTSHFGIRCNSCKLMQHNEYLKYLNTLILKLTFLISAEMILLDVFRNTTF